VGKSVLWKHDASIIEGKANNEFMHEDDEAFIIIMDNISNELCGNINRN